VIGNPAIFSTAGLAASPIIYLLQLHISEANEALFKTQIISYKRLREEYNCPPQAILDEVSRQMSGCGLSSDLFDSICHVEVTFCNGWIEDIGHGSNPVFGYSVPSSVEPYFFFKYIDGNVTWYWESYKERILRQFNEDAKKTICR
jgi:hypothetical protein